MPGSREDLLSLGLALIIRQQMSSATNCGLPEGTAPWLVTCVAPARGTLTGLSKRVWNEEADRCAGHHLALPRHPPVFTAHSWSCCSSPAPALGCLSGTPMTIVLSPNHHCSLAQRMTLPPTRDAFPIPATAESNLVYILGCSGIYLGYTSSSSSETHHSLPN